MKMTRRHAICGMMSAAASSALPRVASIGAERVLLYFWLGADAEALLP